MSDAAIITIISVLVAGIAGPGITAWATTKGQRRRFRHERTMHDLEAARDALDALADSIHAANSAAVEAAHSAPGEREQRCDEAGSELTVAYQCLAHVRVRLSDDSPAVQAARWLLATTADLVHDAESPDFHLTEDDERLRELRAAHDEFYAAAHKTVGTRPTE